MTRFKSARGCDDPNTVRCVLLASTAFALLAVSADAEMYRCKGPDGKLLFTGDASSCPGAAPHAPSRDVQRLNQRPGAALDAPASPAVPEPAPAKRRDPAESEDAQAAMWKRKRLEAEAEKRTAERNLAELEGLVTWCNRGGELTIEDQVGVRQNYSCQEAYDGHAKVSERVAELRRYLSGGLEDECREAGCLPGWIR